MRRRWIEVGKGRKVLQYKINYGHDYLNCNFLGVNGVWPAAVALSS